MKTRTKEPITRVAETLPSEDTPVFSAGDPREKYFFILQRHGYTLNTPLTLEQYQGLTRMLRVSGNEVESPSFYNLELVVQNWADTNADPEILDRALDELLKSSTIMGLKKDLVVKAGELEKLILSFYRQLDSGVEFVEKLRSPSGGEVVYTTSMGDTGLYIKTVAAFEKYSAFFDTNRATCRDLFSVRVRKSESPPRAEFKTFDGKEWIGAEEFLAYYSSWKDEDQRNKKRRAAAFAVEHLREAVTKDLSLAENSVGGLNFSPPDSEHNS